MRNRSEESGAFAEFGSLTHKLMELYLKGNLLSFELADEYTNRYATEVSDSFPPSKVRLYDKYYK